jgi:hypothetical protein
MKIFPRSISRWLLAIGIIAATLFIKMGTATAAEPKQLIVHYMPWYQAKYHSGYWGFHWTMNHYNPDTIDGTGRRDVASHYYPLIGAYDSSDPVALEYHVLLMKLAGIDGVNVDWYGTNNFWDYAVNNTATAKLSSYIQKAGLKFSLCYEDATVLHMVNNNHITAGNAIPNTQQTMLYAQPNYFSFSNCFRLNGAPVLLNFGPQYFTASSSWSNIFSVLNATNQPAFFTLDNRLAPAAQGAFAWPPMWMSGGGTLSMTQLRTYLSNMEANGSGWPAFVGGAFPRFHDIYQQAGIGSSYGYLDDNNGETFKETLERSITNASAFVQLITWNDFGEGTIIEPTREYGYRDLGIVQDYRRQFIDTNFPYHTNDLTLAMRVYNLRRQYTNFPTAYTNLDRVFTNIVAGNLTAADTLLQTIESGLPVLILPSNTNINELVAHSSKATATSPIVPTNSLTFSKVSGPAGLTVASSGTVSWTPTESQGGTTNTVQIKVADNRSPPSSATNTYTIIVNEVNAKPSLTVPSNRTNVELATLTFTNTATDSDIPANTLAFSLTSAPVGMLINTNTGVITWTPAEDQAPSTNTVTVRVTDDGSPSTNDTKSFVIVVTETNSAPVLAAISDRVQFAGSQLTITNVAIDADIPTNTLTFSLDSAPTGMVINASSGVISWTPSEAQIGTNNVVVRVTDNGVPALFGTKSFTITVEHVNLAPILAAISDRTVHIGGTVTFTNSATDPETNALSFSLLAGAPADAAVDATNGVFIWTTTNATINGVSNITVRVTDDGNPQLSDEKSFSVSIIGPIVIQSIFVSNNSTATFTWNSAPGAIYRAQYKTNITQSGWIDLIPNIPAAGAITSRTEEVEVGIEKYYRVVLVNY